MIRLISSTMTELTHTNSWLTLVARSAATVVPQVQLTLFANQAVVTVVGIVGISSNCTATIADSSEVEF